MTITAIYERPLLTEDGFPGVGNPDVGSLGAKSQKTEPKTETEEAQEAPPPSEPEASGEKKPRKRDLVWDAVVEVLGWEPKTRQEGTRVGKAVREIRAAVPDDAPDETIALAVHGRARRYHADWPNAELTPEALVKHWSRFGPKTPQGDDRERTRAERQADPAFTTDAWAEHALTEEERAAARRRIAWHALTKQEAEAEGRKWEATDPPEDWEPPLSTLRAPESSEQGADGGSAAKGAA